MTYQLQESLILPPLSPMKRQLTRPSHQLDAIPTTRPTTSSLTSARRTADYLRALARVPRIPTPPQTLKTLSLRNRMTVIQTPLPTPRLRLIQDVPWGNSLLQPDIELAHQNHPPPTQLIQLAGADRLTQPRVLSHLPRLAGASNLPRVAGARIRQSSNLHHATRAQHHHTTSRHLLPRRPQVPGNG